MEGKEEVERQNGMVIIDQILRRGHMAHDLSPTL